MAFVRTLAIAVLVLLGTNTYAALDGGFAARDQDIKNAQCRYSVLKSTAEIQTYFTKKTARAERTNFEILGFKFVNEYPLFIQLFRDLVAPTINQELVGEPAVVDQARKSCHSVKCALSLILGKNEYLKSMYLLDKYRFNVSPVKYFGMQNFAEQDLDLILETMELIPPHLLPLKELQPLTHTHKDEKRDDGQYAVSTIELYPLWDTETREAKKYILFHEIAHNWSTISSMELDESEEWLKISGWIKIPGGFTVGWEHPYATQSKQAQYPWISKYSTVNSWEDFAESVSAYRFTPAKLLKQSPARYKFIKEKIFGNIEFMNGKSCHLNTQAQYLRAIEQRAVRALDTKVNDYNARTMEIESVLLGDKILKDCSSELAKLLLNRAGGVSEFNHCFKQRISKNLEENVDWLTLDRETLSLKTEFGAAKEKFIRLWLQKTYITQKFKDVAWNASGDINCSNFAKSFNNRYVITSPIATPDEYEVAKLNKAVAPAVGYWICADAKRKKQKSAIVSNSGLEFLMTWLRTLGVFK